MSMIKSSSNIIGFGAPSSSSLSPLHGADRGGLNAAGWAEVPENRIGGHPELETVTPPGAGGLNGPQPQTDPATGAPISRSIAAPLDKPVKGERL